MPARIEDYAIIGDTRSVGLVARNGSIDWMCLPRFDSGACFAALLGEKKHGRWQLAPCGEVLGVRRRYRGDTLILETEITTHEGTVRIIDCMPPAEDVPNVVRIVEGVKGTVSMHLELVIRFDYGWVVPWVRKLDGALLAVGGPDALVLRTPIATHGENLTTVADFTVHAGERVPFVLTWFPSAREVPPTIDAEEAIVEAERWWEAWSSRCTYKGEWRDAVMRSLITLKALTFTPTGGIVAAPTTSLPEAIGGPRNWDYRFAWLRDATFTLYSLMEGGFRDEACAWRDWLLRAIAGDPSQLQVLYGVAGERRIPEQTLPWLPGYAGSHPVRIGNAAVHQLQLDVYGEVIDTLFHARRSGLNPDLATWNVETKLLEFLESNWSAPDEGLWEVRSGRQHFTHSKVMAWVAFDRAVKTIEMTGVKGPLDRWRAMRDEIHTEVCQRGYNPTLKTFTQAYDSPALDGSLLMLPQVGFLPYSDPRIVSTIAAIERSLLVNGYLLRYRRAEAPDGVGGHEGVFLLCTFWLADCYAMTGRIDEARTLYGRLLDIRNDVGLLAEEYDPIGCRQLGNFPQAFSHVGLINTAYNLSPATHAPAVERKAS
jgi:GH15 family glucan-1,4-alpha-glucosidase